MIGTTDSEWLILGGENGITPTNVRVLRQSSYGSEYKQATFVADTLLFFQKGGRKLREYTYSNDNKAYLANDLTFFADHITETGIRDIAYQLNPDSILWAVRNDGYLIGLTYNRVTQIFGWHKHQTKGFFESVATIEGSGDEDELWVVVKREINGSTYRSIEYFNPRSLPGQSDVVFSDMSETISIGNTFNIANITDGTTIKITYTGIVDFATDDYVKINFTGIELIDRTVFQVKALHTGSKTFELYSGGVPVGGTFDDTEIGTVKKVSKTITGLTHLIGETVSILGDGAVFPLQEVSGTGTLTLNSYVNKVVAGLPYAMEIIPESVEIPGNVTLGAKRRISRVFFRLYKTLGGFVGAGYDTLQEIRYRETDVPFGSPPALYTGIKDLPINDSSGEEQSVVLYHDQPLPFTVLAIVFDITYSR